MASEPRHEVGKVYPFIRVTFEGQQGEELYHPWEHQLTKIDLIPLTCVEHRKVRSEWEPEDAEPTYDGFTFTDSSDRIWELQLPYASYGQLNTDGDFIATTSDLEYQWYWSLPFHIQRLHRFIATANSAKLLPVAQLKKTWDHLTQLRQLCEEQLGIKIVRYRRNKDATTPLLGPQFWFYKLEEL